MTLILTLSDRAHAGTYEDLSGPAVVRILHEAGLTGTATKILPDDQPLLEQTFREAIAAGTALIVTTGGTGLAARDITPEATLAVCDRLIPGLAEEMRAASRAETPFAALSRAVCGTAGRTLIVNLPGSPTGAATCLRAILPQIRHALAQLAGHTDHP